MAEGGENASVPYGLVNSRWCMKEEGWCRYYAKEILRIQANRCFGDNDFMVIHDLIECIGRQYAPPSAHHLNRNWVKNVTYFYNKED